MPDTSFTEHEIRASRPIKKGKPITLSRREVECVDHLAHGFRSEAIAYELGVKRVTVDLHISNAKRKLGALTREHAVAIAINLGIVDLDG